MLIGSCINVRYGDFQAVKDLSFSLEAGQWLMLAGPNGAGKSTLVEAIAQGVPYTGDIRLDGQDLRAMKPAQLARRLGVLSQRHGAAYAYTVEEVVAMGRYAHRAGLFSSGSPQDRDMVERALAMTGMQGLRRASMLTLSGGEAQRAYLAQVFAQDPQVLILDEPANHLDLKYQQQVFSLIRDWLKTPGRAVISVVHDLSLARRYGTEALLMNHGECVSFGPMDQALSPRNLQAVYEMDVYGWMRHLMAPWKAE